MSYREAYLHFLSLLAGIQCGHTFSNYYNQSGLIQQVVFDQPDKLPFTFRAIENRMILTNNASQAQELKTGTEILSINGIPGAAIFNALEKYIRSDGNNPYKKTAELSLLGVGPYETFDVFFPLLFPPDNGVFELNIKDIL